MKKNLFYLIIIFIVLLIAVFFVMQKEGEKSLSAEDRQYLYKLDSLSIDKFEMKSKYGLILLQKEGTTWYLTKPLRYPADKKRINLAISTVINLIVKTIASDNPKKQSLYEVDSSALTLKIYEKGKLKGHFYIGKAGPTRGDNYIRKYNSNEVLLVRGSLSFLFDSPDSDWRDKTILSINPNEIKKIEFQYEKDSFTLQFTDSLWMIGDIAANKDEIDRITNNLAELKTDFFKDTPPDTIPKLYAVITFNDKQIKFYKLDEEQFLAQSSDSTQWFIVLKSKISNILKRREDFIKKVEV